MRYIAAVCVAVGEAERGAEVAAQQDQRVGEQRRGTHFPCADRGAYSVRRKNDSELHRCGSFCHLGINIFAHVHIGSTQLTATS